MTDSTVDGIDLTTMQTDVSNLQAALATMAGHPSTDPTVTAQIAAMQQTISDLLAKETADETTIANLSSQLTALQSSELTQQEVQAIVTQMLAAPPPATGGTTTTPPPTGGTGTTPPPDETQFKPINPTPLDVYTNAATFLINLVDPSVSPLWGKTFNIISTNSASTQIQYSGDGRAWTQQTNTNDGGAVWVEDHASGTNVTLYFCAPGISLFSQAPSAPADGGATTPPPPVVLEDRGAPSFYQIALTPAPSDVLSDPDFIKIDLSGYGEDVNVYHLGKMHPALPADGDVSKTKHLGPYSIVLLDGSTLAVPCHWWNSRWTDRSKAPLTIVKTPAQLVAERSVFPYGDPDGLLMSGGLADAYAPYKGPMYTCEVTIYEPTTGERSDIGLMTDHAAKFLAGAPPDGMFAWAEVGGTCPVHYSDDATGQIVDKIKYPYANAYDLPGYMGSPFLPKGPFLVNTDGTPVNSYSATGGNFVAQQAHHPDYLFVATMATRKPSLLLNLQSHGNFGVLDASLTTQAGFEVISGEYRAIAWSLRSLAAAWYATKTFEAEGLKTGDGTPFKNSTYFKTLLDQTLGWYSAPARQNDVFHILGAPGGGTLSSWQNDYLLQVVAWMVLIGLSDWSDLYLYLLQNVIDRTSGTSGFPPGWGGFYYMDASKPSWAAAFADLAINNQQSLSPTTAQYAALAANPLDPGTGEYTIVVGWEYLMGTHSVLSGAIYLDNQGFLATRAKYPGLDASIALIKKQLGTGAPINPRDCVLSGPLK